MLVRVFHKLVRKVDDGIDKRTWLLQLHLFRSVAEEKSLNRPSQRRAAWAVVASATRSEGVFIFDGFLGKGGRNQRVIPCQNKQNTKEHQAVYIARV